MEKNQKKLNLDAMNKQIGLKSEESGPTEVEKPKTEKPKDDGSDFEESQKSSSEHLSDMDDQERSEHIFKQVKLIANREKEAKEFAEIEEL